MGRSPFTEQIPVSDVAMLRSTDSSGAAASCRFGTGHTARSGRTGTPIVLIALLRGSARRAPRVGYQRLRLIAPDQQADPRWHGDGWELLTIVSRGRPHGIFLRRSSGYQAEMQWRTGTAALRTCWR